MDAKLNIVGKLFLSALAAWSAGKKTGLKIKGTKQEIEVLTSALDASNEFQKELRKTDATVESVVEKLASKHAKGKEFEELTGIPWPL